MRFQICKKCGELFNVETPCHPEFEDKRRGPSVWGDIEPYKSMITGEIIGSRSRHRSHMREHGVIEAGNEQKYFMNMDKAGQVTENDARKHSYAPELKRQAELLKRKH